MVTYHCKNSHLSRWESQEVVTCQICLWNVTMECDQSDFWVTITFLVYVCLMQQWGRWQMTFLFDISDMRALRCRWTDLKRWRLLWWLKCCMPQWYVWSIWYAATVVELASFPKCHLHSKKNCYLRSANKMSRWFDLCNSNCRWFDVCNSNLLLTIVLKLQMSSSPLSGSSRIGKMLWWTQMVKCMRSTSSHLQHMPACKGADMGLHPSFTTKCWWESALLFFTDWIKIGVSIILGTSILPAEM
jgi:hypothetical protein